MRVCIIGAGVSGLVLATKLKSLDHSIDVVLLEQNSEVGKKILATGNGKCNFTNTDISENYYNKNYHKFIKSMNQDVRSYMSSLGLLSKVMPGTTRVYPYTEQATTYRDTLLNRITKDNVDVRLNTKVLGIKHNNNYEVTTTKGSITCDKVCICSGGMSSPNLGSDGSMFSIIESLGIKVINRYPGLTGLKSSDKNIKILDGLRVKADVILYENGTDIHHEYGEVQFKKDGISGVCVMNTESRIYRMPKESHEVFINFIPDIDKEFLRSLISERLNNHMFPLSGIINDKLSKYILKDVSFSDIESIIDRVTNFKYEYTEGYDFSTSQVTCGGVCVDTITEEFESIIHKGLYILGEAINVDGDCGGYNMHFAAGAALTVAENIVNNHD